MAKIKIAKKSVQILVREDIVNLMDQHVKKAFSSRTTWITQAIIEKIKKEKAEEKEESIKKVIELDI